MTPHVRLLYLAALRRQVCPDIHIRLSWAYLGSVTRELMTKPIPDVVIRACVAARLNPGRLFCYEVTEDAVILCVCGVAEPVRVPFGEIERGDRDREGRVDLEGCE